MRSTPNVRVKSFYVCCFPSVGKRSRDDQRNFLLESLGWRGREQQDFAVSTRAGRQPAFSRSGGGTVERLQNSFRPRCGASFTQPIFKLATAEKSRLSRATLENKRATSHFPRAL